MIEPVDPSVVAAFRRDGVVTVRAVLDQTALEELGSAIERDMASPGPFYHGYASDEGRFHGNLRLWEHDPVFRAVCLKEPLPQLARQFLESAKVNLLYDQLFVKEAAMAQRTRWHNDQPYWPIRGSQILSVWVALDPTTEENGRLEFIRGSHRWNRWFQPEAFGKTGAIDYERNPDFEDIPDIESDRDSYDIISWDLQPGDAYVFHGMTVHGAGGNRKSDCSRRGYTIRYTGDDITYDIRPGLSQPLVHEGLQQGDALDSERYPVIIKP